jgi:hypothetical protein
MDLRRLAIVATVAIGISSAAEAAEIRVFGARYDLAVINEFYDSLPGHNSAIISALTPATLAGVSLLWAVQPSAPYGADQLSAMAGFLATGGRIAFMGEHGNFAPDENNRINAAIAALGGTIRINNIVVDGGFRTASRLNGQILDHPLTEGVNRYEYAAFAPLIVEGTAEVLMRGQAANTIMMAYQNIGPGSIFVITDQNVWDGSPRWSGQFDNGRMFQNLLVAETGAPPVTAVPAPAGLALFGLGLAGLAAARRRP